MRPPWPALLSALTVLTLAGVAMDASAWSIACVQPAFSTLGTPSFALVTGTLGYMVSSTCTFGAQTSTAPPCPVPVGPQPGEYCGPIIGPFSKAVCTWFPVINTVPTTLYAGFDYTGDGNVYISGEHLKGPIAPFPMAGVINNTTPNPGRIIAYTTNTANNVAAPGDLNLVRCT